MKRTNPIMPPFNNFRELWDRLGCIPPERIRTRPPVGTATEEDLLRLDRSLPLCELIDRTLVEKTMGFYESRVALVLGGLMDAFAEAHDLGLIFGTNVLLYVDPGQVRMPDACFYSRTEPCRRVKS